MRYSAAILLVGATVAGVGAGAGGSAPKPSLVPVAWELDFQYSPPQPITLRLPGQERPQTYWYMLYTITNQTGKDRIFVPEFVLYTDTGQVLRAGEKVRSSVFQAIKKRHNRPLLLDKESITGRILQGEDNAREGVAIWRDFDPQARGFDVFVGGLSGERVRVKLPAPVKVTVVDASGKEKRVVKTEITLVKTLHLQYRLPGEAAARDRTKVEAVGKAWVMR